MLHGLGGNGTGAASESKWGRRGQTLWGAVVGGRGCGGKAPGSVSKVGEVVPAGYRKKKWKTGGWPPTTAFPAVSVGRWWQIYDALPIIRFCISKIISNAYIFHISNLILGVSS